MTIDRYHRQTLLRQIGTAGQEKLAAASVLLVGCGALGSTIGEQLVRSGIGRIRIADRDIVELTNLQRQVLFDEDDVKQGLPKCVAAANRLAKINSTIHIDAKVMDVDSLNIEELCDGVDLILDGTDNVATRYLINDVALKLGKPWIYGACVGTEGRVMLIQPTGPCLRCVYPQPPDEVETCDTAGVLGPVAAVVGSMQAIAAIKWLIGNVADEMLVFDLWSNRIRVISTADAKNPACPACGKHQYEFLESRDRDMTARLCGRDAVQVRSGSNLTSAAMKLANAGKIMQTPFMVRCTLSEGGLSLTAFADGRVLVQGTSDPARARSVVARYLGA